MSDANANVAELLCRHAAARPAAVAVYFPQSSDSAGRVAYTHYTFRQLDEVSGQLANGLVEIGIGRGVRAVLMVPPSLDFFALVFALFKAGAVPVVVDPGMGARHLGRCLAEAAPAAFIGVPKAHVARIVFGWGRESLRTLVTVGRRLGWRGPTLGDVFRLGQSSPPNLPVRPDPEQTAALLFTSGSTGVPKGAVYTHPNFIAQIESLQRTFGIAAGEIDLATFPLFALFAPAMGMTAVVPRMDPTRPARVQPARIVRAIEDFGVTNLFGSPALLDRVSRGVPAGTKFPTLRRVVSAGAPVSARIIEQFSRLLAPGVEVFTPYGATEALPVASIGSAEILGATRERTLSGGGVCVGRPLPGLEVAIIPIRDEPIPRWSGDLALPQGSIGEIVVKGPAVTREYYSRPQATALAKIADSAGGFFHRMGDLGYFDETGRLWFCGRKAHRVAAGDSTLFTVPCEQIFNAHPAVYRTALVAAQRDATTIPVLCVELEKHARHLPKSQISQELLHLGARQPQTQAIRTILFHPSFPVDIRHNAKIFREHLAAWATRQLRRAVPGHLQARRADRE